VVREHARSYLQRGDGYYRKCVHSNTGVIGTKKEGNIGNSYSDSREKLSWLQETSLAAHAHFILNCFTCI